MVVINLMVFFFNSIASIVWRGHVFDANVIGVKLSSFKVANQISKVEITDCLMFGFVYVYVCYLWFICLFSSCASS